MRRTPLQEGCVFAATLPLRLGWELVLPSIRRRCGRRARGGQPARTRSTARWRSTSILRASSCADSSSYPARRSAARRPADHLALLAVKLSLCDRHRTPTASANQPCDLGRVLAGSLVSAGLTWRVAGWSGPIVHPSSDRGIPRLESEFSGCSRSRIRRRATPRRPRRRPSPGTTSRRRTRPPSYVWFRSGRSTAKATRSSPG